MTNKLKTINKIGCITILALFAGFIIYLSVYIYINVFYFSPMNGRHFINVPIKESELNFYNNIKKSNFPKVDSVKRIIFKRKSDWRNNISIYYYVGYNREFMEKSVNRYYFDSLAYKTLIFIRSDDKLSKYNFMDIKVCFECNKELHPCGTIYYNFIN